MEKNKKLKNSSKKEKISDKRHKQTPFSEEKIRLIDKVGHYDIDGVSYDSAKGEIVVSSDGIDKDE